MVLAGNLRDMGYLWFSCTFSGSKIDGWKCRVIAAIQERLKRRGLELPGREAIGRERSGCGVRGRRREIWEEVQGLLA
ncbi:MAG: hypothetical protein ACI8TQ_000990, partial [Planctomycetota bacterium]